MKEHRSIDRCSFFLPNLQGLNMTKLSLSKSERIKSRKLIGEIFEQGEKLKHGPLLGFFLKVDESLARSPFMFGVTVPKRSHRKAVHRNLIKRRVREAYRINKSIVKTDILSDTSYALFVVYLDRNIRPFDDIEIAMKKLLSKWINSKTDKHHEK